MCWYTSVPGSWWGVSSARARSSRTLLTVALAPLGWHSPFGASASSSATTARLLSFPNRVGRAAPSTGPLERECEAWLRFCRAQLTTIRPPTAVRRWLCA